MSTNVGKIDMEMLLNSNPFNKSLKDTEKTIKNSGIEKSLKSIENNAKSTINTVKNSGLEKTLMKISKAALAAFSVKSIISFGKECLSVATETSNAWIGLNSILTGQRKSFDQAKNFIQEYVSDGLVPLNNAVAAYKNLTLRGYNSEQIQKTMNALKNSATFARQSTYTLGDAVQTATEGLKNENSVVVDNAGVTKNVAKMWEDYAKSIGKTTNNLTQAEKIQAEVNGILEETKFQSNDAATYANTYSGKIAQLNTAFTNLKTAVGNVIQPIAKLFIPIVTKAVNAVTKLFTAISSVLALFGLKADGVENMFGGVGDLAEDASNASDAVEGIGDSAKKAKKGLLGLRSIDAINNISTNSDNSGSGSGGSGGTSGGLDFGGLEASNTILDGVNDKFTKLIEKAKELFAIVKSGFFTGFGDTNFDGIIQNIIGIRESLKNIFMSQEVVGSAQNLVNVWLFTIGQVAGSMSRIGVNIAENLYGGIDLYLQQNAGRIRSFISNMFNISADDLSIVGNFWQAIGEISDVFKGAEAKQITADIISMFANPIMNAYEILRKFETDIRSLLLKPITDNADKIKTALENSMAPIQKFTGLLSTAMTYVSDKWNEVYTKYIQPHLTDLREGLSDTFSKFLDVYNTYLVPFFDKLTTKLSELWEQHLKPYVDDIVELIGTVIQSVNTFWNQFLKPFIDWIIENIIPVLVPIIEMGVNVFIKHIGTMIDIIRSFIKIAKGLIDFVVGVFTGDWKKAWDGIKSIFTGIWDAIKGFIALAWNNMFGVIGQALKKITTEISNKFSNIYNDVKNKITNIKNSISSIFGQIYEKIKNIFNNIKNHISDKVYQIKDKIATVFGQVKDKAVQIWDNIKNKIREKVDGIKDKLTNTFQSAYNKITSIFRNIGTFFGGIWSKISNTFSSLGTKIGNAISNAVKSGLNRVISQIESTINRGISLINGAINVINKLPGVSVGNISKLYLPRLAEGGYVKANTPQLAMIGDNRHQGEVVAPEGKIHEIVADELKKYGVQGNNGEIITLLKEIAKSLRTSTGDTILKVGEIELARAVIRGLKLLQSKSDKPILDFI